MSAKKRKRAVDVRVAGDNYQKQDPMDAIMETLDGYEEGTPPKKLDAVVRCDHTH